MSNGPWAIHRSCRLSRHGKVFFFAGNPHSCAAHIPPCTHSRSNCVFRTPACPASCRTSAIHCASQISSRATYSPLSTSPVGHQRLSTMSARRASPARCSTTLPSLNGSGSGLDVPWIQTPPAEPEPGPRPLGQAMLMHPTSSLNNSRWKERLKRSSAKPVEAQDPPTIEGWRDSLRNNIANTFGVFTPPALAARPNVTTYDWQHSAAPTPAIARAVSIASSATSRPWTLEETHDGAGIVHIRGVLDPAPTLSLHSSSRSNGSRALPPTPSSILPLPLPRASLMPPVLPRSSYLCA